MPNSNDTNLLTLIVLDEFDVSAFFYAKSQYLRGLTILGGNKGLLKTSKV